MCGGGEDLGPDHDKVSRIAICGPDGEVSKSDRRERDKAEVIAAEE